MVASVRYGRKSFGAVKDEGTLFWIPCDHVHVDGVVLRECLCLVVRGELKNAR